MKALNGYKDATTYSDREKLPVGGYVVKIMNVEYQTNQYGDSIVLSFDIIEGEYKDFFRRDYNSQTGDDKKWRGTYYLRVPKDDGTERDGWTMRRFKTTTVAFEESNPGYHWDWEEQTLKNKIVGVLYNNKEYDINGHHGFSSACHSMIPAEKVRSGNFKIPPDKLLDANGSKGNTSGTAGDLDFMNLPDGLDDELPWK